MTCFYELTKNVKLCGLSAYKTDDAETASTFLGNFFRQLRAVPSLKNSVIVFCCERGTGHDATLFAAVARQYMPCYLLSQRGDGRLGWITTRESKVQQLNVATQCLQLDAMHFMTNWIYETGFDSEAKTPETREDIMNKLRTQLFNYGTYETANGNICVSGQIDSDSGVKNLTMRDDLAFVFCFSLGIMRELMNQSVPGAPYDMLFPQRVSWANAPQ